MSRTSASRNSGTPGASGGPGTTGRPGTTGGPRNSVPPGLFGNTRTGYEPTKARSALRLRLALALLGLVWGVGAAVGFAFAGQPGWAGVCAFVALIAVADVLVVVHRIRQGSRYQPGRDVPPGPPVGTRRRTGDGDG